MKCWPHVRDGYKEENCCKGLCLMTETFHKIISCLLSFRTSFRKKDSERVLKHDVLSWKKSGVMSFALAAEQILRHGDYVPRSFWLPHKNTNGQRKEFFCEASLCKCVRRQSACIFDEEQGSLVTFMCERQSLKCSEEEEEEEATSSSHTESNNSITSVHTQSLSCDRVEIWFKYWCNPILYLIMGL